MIKLKISLLSVNYIVSSVYQNSTKFSDLVYLTFKSAYGMFVIIRSQSRFWNRVKMTCILLVAQETAVLYRSDELSQYQLIFTACPYFVFLNHCTGQVRVERSKTCLTTPHSLSSVAVQCMWLVYVCQICAVFIVSL